MAAGMGLVMAPATESIMGSLPRAKAGVGSAVNDTTRQVGGALGVAVIGSVMTSMYGSRGGSRHHRFTHSREPELSAPPVRTFPPRSASRPTSTFRRGAVQASCRSTTFVTGLHRGVLFAAAATLIGVIIVLRSFPPTAPT